MKGRLRFRDERGLQTLEWVALGLVILALLGAVFFYLSYQASETTGRTVGETISHFFECVQRLDFDCAQRALSGEGGAARPRRDVAWCITHPLDCWRDVVWPAIQRGAKWVWERFREAGSWLVKQWNKWLKGALAGLLAAIVVIIGLLILVAVGLVAPGLAIVAGIVALVVAVAAGIISQLRDPNAGFWSYFKNSLTWATIAAGLVISGGTAILKGMILEWLKSGAIPALVSMAIDALYDINGLFDAIQSLPEDPGKLISWIGIRLINGMITYITSLATWGFMEYFVPKWRFGTPYTPRELLNRFRWLFAVHHSLTLRSFLNLSGILLINISALYLSGVITGKKVTTEEYLVVGACSVFTWPVFELMNVAGIPNLAVEVTKQVADKLVIEMVKLKPNVR